MLSLISLILPGWITQLIDLSHRSTILFCWFILYFHNYSSFVMVLIQPRYFATALPMDFGRLDNV